MTTRNAYQWAWAQLAIWNIPRGISNTLVAAGMPKRGLSFTGQSGTVYNYSGGKAVDGRMVPVNMDPTQTNVPVYKNAGQNSSLRPYAVTPITNVLGGYNPPSPGNEANMNPSLIVPASGSNSTAALIGSDGVTVYEFGQFYHGDSGTYVGTNPATSSPHTPGVCTAGHGGQRGVITGDSITGVSNGSGEAGSGLSSLGGIFRLGEWTTAYNGGGTPLPIPHALRVDLNGHTDMSHLNSYSSFNASTDGTGFRWPATKADGTCDQIGTNNFYDGLVPQCREGAHLALKNGTSGSHGTVAKGWIASDLYVGGAFGIQTTPGAIMALTALYFGWYPCNDATDSRVTFPFEQAYNTVPDSSGLPPEFHSLFGFHFVQPVNGSGVGTGDSPAFAADMQLIITRLFVDDSNTQAQYTTNIGNGGATGAGGGAPIYALAPPFGSGSLVVLQDVQGATTSASTSLPVANAATTAGSTLTIVVGAKAGSGVPTISISGGGTWATRVQQASASGNGKVWIFDLIGASSVGANGITINSTKSGSIEYEFFELAAANAAAVEIQVSQASPSSDASPTVSDTPGVSSDLAVAGIFWPTDLASISGLTGVFTSDATIVGVA